MTAPATGGGAIRPGLVAGQGVSVRSFLFFSSFFEKRCLVIAVTSHPFGTVLGWVHRYKPAPHRKEAKMLVNRTSLLTLAAVTTLAMVATGAEAGFLCNRGGGGFARAAYNPVRAYTPVVPQQRVVKVAKPKYDEPSSKSASHKRPPSAESVKSASVAGAASAPAAGASLASATKPASASSEAKPAAANTTVSTATATKTCLSKEYLDSGAVRFNDTCTKEWAINSTNVETKTSKVDNTCLTKENSQNGVVMFKDTCTGEWAMNTSDQLALAQPR